MFHDFGVRNPETVQQGLRREMSICFRPRVCGIVADNIYGHLRWGFWVISLNGKLSFLCVRGDTK